ncbi:MAG: MBL fold metallo-hydrolase [Coprobacter sp.]|nr:MBL fold metallo-hydrolase [Coprobacter sp.]
MKRTFYAALAAISLTTGCMAPQQKETAENPISSDEVKTLQIGDVKITWIQDMAASHSPNIFPDADAGLIDSLQLQEGIPSSMSAFLAEQEGSRILFDTGMGSEQSRLIPLLNFLGLKPADIDYLYLTHLHGDHIGGMMQGDEIVFPQTAVYLSQAEYDGWMQMPNEQNAQAVKTGEAYREQLHLFQFGDTLPGNVLPIDATGHTPGHTAYQIGQILIIGDLIHGAALQLEHPDICARFDMDKEQAIASRKKILQYARDNGLVIAGMHLPGPAFIRTGHSKEHR